MTKFGSFEPLRQYTPLLVGLELAAVLPYEHAVLPLALESFLKR